MLFSFLNAQNDSLIVKVKVSDFKNSSGEARILVFDREDGFPSKPENAIMQFNKLIINNKCDFDLNLIPGEYAVSIHHDENNNDEIDTTWYGKPVEGFGVSNNPKTSFGPPDYDDSKVIISNPQILKIKMKYF